MAEHARPGRIRAAARETLGPGAMPVSLLHPDSFETFRRNLAEAIAIAEETGIPGRLIQRQAVAVGDYLARHVEPTTPEQRLLKELWDVGTEAERRALAAMLVRWAERTSRPAG